jgi:negative regulator of replication initiation
MTLTKRKHESARDVLRRSLDVQRKLFTTGPDTDKLTKIRYVRRQVRFILEEVIALTRGRRQAQKARDRHAKGPVQWEK